MSRVDTSRRIRPAAELRAAASRWRAEGLAIVVARGTFDLLRAGHARALRTLAASADRLIVAVVPDAAAGRALGAGRPVTPAMDRARGVAALRQVDAVALLDDAALEELLSALGPSARIETISAEIETALWARLRDAGGPE